ncbi:MAG TPA: hypothetical protein VF006_25125 [Longimicrobium sp.]
MSLGPLVIGGYTGVELTTIEWIKAYTLYLAAGAATIFLPPGLFLVSRRWRRKTGGWSEAISFVYLIFFVMIASVIVTPALMVLLPFSSSLILFGVVMGIGMPGLALIGILAGGVLELPGVILKGRRRRRRYADTYIVNSLARALIVLHHSPATRPRTFSTAARELEQVAVRLERDLPHFLGAQGDEYPSLREAADEMAAFQRTLGRRLLVPSRAVLAECVGAIRSSFVAAALADWAELPRQQVTSSMRRRTRLAQALSGVRLIVVAVSPIAVARLLDAYDVIDGPASGYAGALAYGWLVLVLLNKLDPDLKDKVALLKDILGMIRGR